MNGRKITIGELEAWRILQLLQELNAFLHQPANYDSQPKVLDWLRGGVYDELRDVLYDIAGEWFDLDDDDNIIAPAGAIPRSARKKLGKVLDAVDDHGVGEPIPHKPRT
jgi:hypothetical protein